MDSIYLSEARVYVAGILMPTITVTITSTFNRPPMAEIVLPAYSELLYMGERDRIPVHVFVRETMVESPEFLLIFEGFISETTYVNSALQRSVAITAISNFDILNDVQVKFMTSFEDIYNSMLDGAKDLANFIYVNKYTFPIYLLKYGLVQGDGKEEGKEIRFPSDYLENIYAYMQMAGPSGNDYLKGQNQSALAEYFGNQARRMRFLDRFVRLPYFDEAGKDGFAWDVGQFKFAGPDGESATIFPMMYGMQASHAFGILAQGANNAAPQQSLMELLTYLVEEMEYEYLFISNPAYFGPGKASTEAASNKKVAQATANVSNIIASAAQNKPNTSTTENSTGGTTSTESSDDSDKLVSSCLKPLFTDTMPPKCNIMYRTLVDNIHMNVVHKGVPTRIQVTNTYSALERVTKNINPSFLTMYGLIDYYPSERYPVFEDAGGETKYKKYLGSELLEVEKYTGPWLRQLHTPRWFHYLHDNIYGNDKAPKIKVGGQEVDAGKVFKERFFRRQLLNCKYLQRQMQANCMFDPYITPGFPGVVFDSGDSSFAFAGHVVTVVHTISPANMSTQVAMNFVRPLHEAVQEKIPNPITSIQDVTHDKNRLSEIYQRLLGSDAVEFEELEGLAISTESPQSANNNANAAYLAKRRNIASFEEYLKFMGFEATLGNGPEGPQTPIILTSVNNQNWLEDRYKLPVYSNTVVFDPIIPSTENVVGSVSGVVSAVENAGGSADDKQNNQQTSQQGDTLTDNPNGGQAQDQSGEQSSGDSANTNAGSQDDDVSTDYLEDHTVDPNAVDPEAGKYIDEQDVIEEIHQQAMKEKAAQEAQEAQQSNKKTIRKAVVADIRTLLRSVAEREFSRMIYK